jgi:hypothetical protein
MIEAAAAGEGRTGCLLSSAGGPARAGVDLDIQVVA